VRVRRRDHWRRHRHGHSWHLVRNPLTSWLLELTR
jgi:hypothetical protein